MSSTDSSESAPSGEIPSVDNTKKAILCTAAMQTMLHSMAAGSVDMTNLSAALESMTKLTQTLAFVEQKANELGVDDSDHTAEKKMAKFADLTEQMVVRLSGVHSDPLMQNGDMEEAVLRTKESLTALANAANGNPGSA